jgi:hypothetical protein
MKHTDKNTVLATCGDGCEKVNDFFEIIEKDSLPKGEGLFIWEGTIVESKNSKEKPQLSGIIRRVMTYDLISYRLM